MKFFSAVISSGAPTRPVISSEVQRSREIYLELFLHSAADEKSARYSRNEDSYSNLSTKMKFL